MSATLVGAALDRGMTVCMRGANASPVPTGHHIDIAIDCWSAGAAELRTGYARTRPSCELEVKRKLPLGSTWVAGDLHEPPSARPPKEIEPSAIERAGSLKTQAVAQQRASPPAAMMQAAPRVARLQAGQVQPKREAALAARGPAALHPEPRSRGS